MPVPSCIISFLDSAGFVPLSSFGLVKEIGHLLSKTGHLSPSLFKSTIPLSQISSDELPLGHKRTAMTFQYSQLEL